MSQVTWLSCLDFEQKACSSKVPLDFQGRFPPKKPDVIFVGRVALRAGNETRIR
jgi:hypothetical protein